MSRKIKVGSFTSFVLLTFSGMGHENKDLKTVADLGFLKGGF